MDFYLYPGVFVNVSAPTKVTMVPLAPNEQPPAGATVIPPQGSPLSQVIKTAAAANLETARQGVVAAHAVTEQQTAEAQAAFDAALTKSNEAAAQLAKEQQAQAGQPPPWEVTFTEKR